MTNIYESENAFLEAQNNWQLEKLYADLEVYGYQATPTKKAHIRGLLLSLTLEEIANTLGVSTSTVSVSVSTELKEPLKSLLESKGIKNKNSNFSWHKTSGLLTRAGYQKSQIKLASKLIENNPNPFIYLDREIEYKCVQEIENPGCLIRIRSPWYTGKTSLVNQILSQAEEKNYLTVKLELRLANQDVFSNLDIFLRWFCAYVSEELNNLNRLQLQIPGSLEDYWDKNFSGSRISCKRYFERNLLSQIPSKLVLALDDIDLIYTNPKIVDEFFELLRHWREEAYRRDIWQKLRLVLAYSRRIYISNIYKSPFNVPETELPEFDIQEVHNLAQKYELNWDIAQCNQLMTKVGGYPFLVQKALAQISSSVITFEKFLDTAHTDTGIYKDLLQQYSLHLQQNSELQAAMRKVVNETDVVKLELKQAYQLEGMGLVTLRDTNATPRCQIYRLYFRECL